MTTSRSQSPKSQPGKSGPDATPLEDKITCENLPQLDRKPPVSESGLADVAPVADSVKKDRVAFRSGQIFLTEQDKKLALKMGRDISTRLGLNSRSRSIRVP
jgi:hypothetical protein